MRSFWPIDELESWLRAEHEATWRRHRDMVHQALDAALDEAERRSTADLEAHLAVHKAGGAPAPGVH